MPNLNHNLQFHVFKTGNDSQKLIDERKPYVPAA